MRARRCQVGGKRQGERKPELLSRGRREASDNRFSGKVCTCCLGGERSELSFGTLSSISEGNDVSLHWYIQKSYLKRVMVEIVPRAEGVW
jgi:hypothetical protein